MDGSWRFQVEEELEAEAKAAEEERKRNPEEEGDHDTRKLPKPERMRLVKKNKEVGEALPRGSLLVVPRSGCGIVGSRLACHSPFSWSSVARCEFLVPVCLLGGEAEGLPVGNSVGGGIRVSWRFQPVLSSRGVV